MADSNTIDDMPNITSNFSDATYHHRETRYERVFLETFTVVGLLAVTANVLMSFVILKYKKMREDATNVIFLHVNILQAIYLLVTPLTLRVAMEFFNLSPVHLTVFCVSYQIETNVMFVTIWFFLLLVCDWYLKLYSKDTYVKFCRVQKFFVIVLYVIMIFLAAVSVQACFTYLMVIYIYIAMVACVGIFVIFLIAMNVMHAFRKRKLLSVPRKGNIGLAVANITFLCWTPFILLLLLGLFGIYINLPVLIIVLFSLGFSGPIFILAYLYNYDDNYSVFLKQVFRCKCNDYRNEDLEDQSVTYSDASGVKLSIS